MLSLRTVLSVTLAHCVVSSGSGEKYDDGTTTLSTLSILGSELEDCSTPGTAMTGFTRDGRCADVGMADRGSHHVCIKMKADFCSVTGQSNWCTEREFPCMEGTSERALCKIENWCVCQWAYAAYLEKAGGCDSSNVELKCGAVNMATLEAYERSGSPTHKAALACIQKRCGVGQDNRNRVVEDELRRS